MACALRIEGWLRRRLDLTEPGWTVQYFPCPEHGEDHEIRSGLLVSAPQGGQVRVSAAPRGRVIEGGQFCTHRTTSQAIAAPCAYCGTRLHVHQDALGAVKSGRAGASFVEERCPACHRANAVLPAYGLGGVRTSQIVDGAPALQLSLLRSA